MHNNLATVQQIYSCFAQGDIPGILAKLADNVVFFNGADPAIASFGGEFKGKDGVIRFFTGLGSSTQTTNFAPSNFSAEGNKVVNDVLHEGIVPATGKPFKVSATFTWFFNDQGEAVDWKGTGDFSSMNEALQN
jgi:ketosteroid isomerase-like protein